jgi:hypothetical protein
MDIPDDPIYGAIPDLEDRTVFLPVVRQSCPGKEKI